MSDNRFVLTDKFGEVQPAVHDTVKDRYTPVPPGFIGQQVLSEMNGPDGDLYVRIVETSSEKMGLKVWFTEDEFRAELESPTLIPEFDADEAVSAVLEAVEEEGAADALLGLRNDDDDDDDDFRPLT